MENITEHLKNIKVLDNNDIVKFKNYIWNKYPKNTTVKNAKILSDAIHKIIYAKLEGLPEDFKLSIKTTILKNTFEKSKDLITLYDIFSCCLNDENLRSNFKEQLVDWINLHVKAKIEVEELETYLDAKNIYLTKTVQLLEEIHIKEEIINSSDMSIEKKYGKDTESIKLNLLTYLNHSKLRIFTALIIICILIIPFYNVSQNLKLNINKTEPKEESYVLQTGKSTSTSIQYSNLNLPQYMRYKEINEKKLKVFLEKNNSLLVKEPYFSTIVSVSKEFNLNPIVLFSITGQEQNFVPKDKDNASKIANNPFNVYHSWKEYNTNIRDSYNVAARKLINLSQNMPKNEDPFLWIGKNYAEDKYWGNGVKSIFKELSYYVN
jgi:hypothetical protein